jgi:Ca2+-binding RTX toxin-like protein
MTLSTAFFKIAQRYLAQFAAHKDFAAKMKIAFGEEVDLDKLFTLRQQWQQQNFSSTPTVELLTNNELGTAYGAYSAANNIIYLSADFLAGATDEAIANLLLEEIGHGIDRLLNTMDATGDEGAIFSALVQGQTLTKSDLTRLRNEDDQSYITLDGQSVLVEQLDVSGNSGSNLLIGTAFGDVILGLDGNDTVYGRDGYDVIDGGNQNDVLYGEEGDDGLYGGLGNDTIDGGNGNDALQGEDGNDFLDGWNGDDIISGGDGNDYLDGGFGLDILYGGAGNDIFSLSKIIQFGNPRVDKVMDFVRGQDKIDLRTLGISDFGTLVTAQIVSQNAVGDAIFRIGAGRPVDARAYVYPFFSLDSYNVLELKGINKNLLVASDFIFNTALTNDSIVGSESYNDDLFGGMGNDTIYGARGYDRLFGEQGNDSLIGGTGDDTLNGGKGNDIMSGEDGSDQYIVEDAGDVVVETSNLAGDIDTVQASVTYVLTNNVEKLTLTGTSAINGTGNSLDNTIVGNIANNTLSGGAGRDNINGYSGADRMIGEAGNDVYVVDNVGDTVIETSALSTEVDVVYAATSYTIGINIEYLILFGTAAINATGNAGSNVLTGNTNNNILTGGAGNDFLNGLTGLDRLVGGVGIDTFVLHKNQGLDTIADFATGEKLRISATEFGGGLVAGVTLTASQFLLSAGATSAANATQRLIFNSSTRNLYFDVDGAGGTASVQIAKLEGSSSLSLGDFLIIT